MNFDTCGDHVSVCLKLVGLQYEGWNNLMFLNKTSSMVCNFAYTNIDTSRISKKKKKIRAESFEN